MQQNINEIAEIIQKSKEMIKAINLTITELEIGHKEPATTVWQKVRRDFAFGVSDSKKRYSQAKQNVEYMKSLVDDIVSGLKNISGNISEYKFNDYGIEKEFTTFYNYFKDAKISSIENYMPHKDIETLTGISEKTASIKHDLSVLENDF